jgi:hypothetical protein
MAPFHQMIKKLPYFVDSIVLIVLPACADSGTMQSTHITVFPRCTAKVEKDLCEFIDFLSYIDRSTEAALSAYLCRLQVVTKKMPHG